MSLLLALDDAFSGTNHPDVAARQSIPSTPCAPHVNELYRMARTSIGQQLQENLRCIANKRHAIVFAADASILRESCTLHGMHNDISNDIVSCFVWMV